MGELRNKTKLRLTEAAIRVIQESPELKSKLALALGCSGGSINRYLRCNAEDLTMMAALLELAAYSGLTFDKLLERNNGK